MAKKEETQQYLSWILLLAVAGLCTGQAYPRQYHLWPAEEIHDTIVQWGEDYSDLIRVSTSQDTFGLPSAGDSFDCPFDGANVGCLNYYGIIQDYVAHPSGSASSNRLPAVLLSGALHGDERVGPTAVMETASLLLRAAACEAIGESMCRQDLQNQGITDTQRQWLARLVTTRRIVIVPTPNALGYYRNVREEGSIDPNRDFPFDQSTVLCMRTIAGRTLNELFRDDIIQLSFTFHGGIELIGYEWGAFPYLNSDTSPDERAQAQLAESFSRYGNGWNGHSSYDTGTINNLLYAVNGGMEDWAYAGSWDTTYVPQCNPSTYGGYASEKTVYNNSTLRAFNMLVETSENKTPSTSDLGTTENVLDQNTSGNGHVSRNIRLSVAAIELVEPYLSIVGVNDMALVGDFAPLKDRSCESLPTIAVALNADQMTIHWTVGGSIEIDETRVWIANTNDVEDAILQGCTAQPDITEVESVFRGGEKLTGFGFLADGGQKPADSSTIGPRFSSVIDASQLSGSDEFLVMVSARVDSSWALQPTNIAPLAPPQAHLVNVRTSSSWYHESANKVVEGRLDWFSIPIRIVRETAAVPTSAPTASSGSPATPIICFSGDCELEVENKGPTKMTDLTLGDAVKVSDNKYEPIYSFGHKNGEAFAEFFQIVTEGDRKPLEISKDHMVKGESGRSVPASMIKIGDMLVTGSGNLVAVKAIRTVVRQGIYAPFTEFGSIIVNDIVSSIYIAYQDSEYLKVAGVETPFTYQWLAHTFNSAHRLAVMVGFTGETYTDAGVSRWVDIPQKCGSWLLDQHAIVAFGILVPSIALFGFVSVLEALFKSPLALATIVVGAVTLFFTRRSFHFKTTKNM